MWGKATGAAVEIRCLDKYGNECSAAGLAMPDMGEAFDFRAAVCCVCGVCVCMFVCLLLLCV